jgi:hypothetical protein
LHCQLAKCTGNSAAQKEHQNTTGLPLGRGEGKARNKRAVAILIQEWKLPLTAGQSFSQRNKVVQSVAPSYMEPSRTQNHSVVAYSSALGAFDTDLRGESNVMGTLYIRQIVPRPVHPFLIVDFLAEPASVCGIRASPEDLKLHLPMALSTLGSLNPTSHSDFRGLDGSLSSQNTVARSRVQTRSFQCMASVQKDSNLP